jgi:tRNA A37 threonylcarbamoyltransferase TsaD
VKSLNPPTLTEAAQGSGGLCGASFLNRIFANFLDEKFRDYPAFDESLKKHALKQFEDNIKKMYVGASDKSYKIAVRGLPNNSRLRIASERLEITAQELKDIFEPVMTEIVKLVKAQIRATQRKVKAVLLAGGFGESEYLRLRLKDALRNRKVDVLQIEHRYVSSNNSHSDIVNHR